MDKESLTQEDKTQQIPTRGYRKQKNINIQMYKKMTSVNVNLCFQSTLNPFWEDMIWIKNSI